MSASCWLIGTGLLIAGADEMAVMAVTSLSMSAGGADTVDAVSSVDSAGGADTVDAVDSADTANTAGCSESRFPDLHHRSRS